MALKDYSSVIKWGVIGGGIALVAYIAYKAVKGIETIPDAFDQFQNSLIQDPNEYTALNDFEQAISIHGNCIYYDVVYEGAWALWGLGAITTKCETKSEMIELLQATQDAFPQENAVNICWMKHKDGFRTMLGNGNQILNYQIDLPMTEQELIDSLNPDHTGDPISQETVPILDYTKMPMPVVEPITLIDGSLYTPVSPATTQEVYEENIRIEVEREIIFEEIIATVPEQQLFEALKLTEMDLIEKEAQITEPVFTIQPVQPTIIAPTTYDDYRSQKLETL